MKASRAIRRFFRRGYPRATVCRGKPARWARWCHTASAFAADPFDKRRSKIRVAVGAALLDPRKHDVRDDLRRGRRGRDELAPLVKSLEEVRRRQHILC